MEFHSITSIFLSRLLYLSKIEKEKGINNNSNICRFYSIDSKDSSSSKSNVNELSEILNINNSKTYYEHLVNREFLRLVIDYDNPHVVSLKDIKHIFIFSFYKFISKYCVIDYQLFKKGIAISKSDNEQTKLHIVYSNIIIKITDLIKLMKIDFKKYIADKKLDKLYKYIDYSIYKSNFNLRLVYAPKHNGKDKLVPIINKNVLNHLVTYYEHSYVISLTPISST